MSAITNIDVSKGNTYSPVVVYGVSVCINAIMFTETGSCSQYRILNVVCLFRNGIAHVTISSLDCFVRQIETAYNGEVCCSSGACTVYESGIFYCFTFLVLSLTISKSSLSNCFVINTYYCEI